MFHFRLNRTTSAFTLIELLIVVSIISVLAAVAVPNFLEAQMRAKVARVKSDQRAMATGIESYRVDHNVYPEGTDNPAKYEQSIGDYLGPLAPGFYAMRTRGPDGEIAGIDFHTLTTPIAYLTNYPLDPFSSRGGRLLPYAYRNAKNRHNGWILTSAGPDVDLLAPDGRGSSNMSNPLSTAVDGKSPARLGDINERGVIHFLEGTSGLTRDVTSKLDAWLEDLSYDPSNGTVSEGDIYRKSGVPQ